MDKVRTLTPQQYMPELKKALKAAAVEIFQEKERSLKIEAALKGIGGCVLVASSDVFDRGNDCSYFVFNPEDYAKEIFNDSYMLHIVSYHSYQDALDAATIKVALSPAAMSL